ncbi:MAG: hypothetical protein RIT81_34865 [Deltaproteobacteria bacterium]
MMRLFLAALAATFLCFSATPAFAKSKVNKGSCSLKGKKLFGKVKIVKHHADLKVKVVKHHPDLKVKKVKHFPNKCGKWKIVEHHADFKIKLVDHHADLKVKWVNNFPGVP